MKKILVLIVLVLASAKISSADDYDEPFEIKHIRELREVVIERLQSVEELQIDYDHAFTINPAATEKEAGFFSVCVMNARIKAHFALTDAENISMFNDKQKRVLRMITSDAVKECKHKLGINNG